MAVNDIYQVTIQLFLDDRNISVGLYYIETEENQLTVAGMSAALATAVKASFWTAYLQPLLSDELIYNGNRVQLVSPSRAQPYDNPEVTPETGALSSPALNGTNAVIVAEYGSDWGPRYRGRMFVPGLPESQVSSGRIEDADYGPFQSAAVTFYGDELEPAGAGQGKYQVCVFSPAKPSAVPPVAAASSYPVVGIVRPRIGTQRRRRTNVKTPS